MALIEAIENNLGRKPAQEVGAHGRESWDRVQAIWKAIDDYADLETGNREYFWNRPHSIG